MLSNILTLALFGVMVTVGWNYGASELLEPYVGQDFNIDVLEGLLTAFFLTAFGKSANITHVTNGE